MNVNFPDLAGAVCAQIDPEIFFPQKGQSSVNARRVCAECPVRLACLEYAMAHPVAGIWGGTSHKQRQEMAHAQGRSYYHDTGITDAERVGVQPQSVRRRELRAGAERARPRTVEERNAREKEARRLAAAGVSRQAIATLLNVSERTVRERYLRRVAS